MKHLLSIFISLAIGACCLASCKASSAKPQASADAKEAKVAAEELIVNTDSCLREEGKEVKCLVKVDYPTEPTELSIAVRKILNQELNQLFMSYLMEGENLSKAYSGDLANGNTVLKYYADANLNYLSKQLKDIKSADPRANINMSSEIILSKKEETDKYITYNCWAYAYLGGAHGSATYYSININKTTKKVLTQTVNTTQTKALQPILRKGVLEYLNYEDGESEVTDSTLDDILFIDNGIIPLPNQVPYLAKDGVHFIYQQYEIGPYAMGFVEFTVPYPDIKAYLTKEALQLIKLE